MIKKNDTVTNNFPLHIPYSTDILPVGTELRVWKTKRNGTIYCTPTNRTLSSSTFTLNQSDVTKLNKPLPTINIGDIYVCSWGYDQTNVDYYKVIEVKNKSAVLVDIGQTRNYTGPMQGDCTPIPSEVGTKTYTKRIIANGDTTSFKMTSYSWAYKWNGKINHFTEWA